MLFYSLQEQQSFSENTMPSGLYRLFSLALEKFQIFASMRAVSHLWNNGCEKKQKIKAPWHSFRWFFLRVSGVPEQAKHVERRGEGEVGSETGSGFRGAIGAVSSGVRVAIGRWFHIQATSSSSSSLLSFGPPRRCSTRTTKSSSGSSANGGPNFPERSSGRRFQRWRSAKSYTSTRRLWPSRPTFNFSTSRQGRGLTQQRIISTMNGDTWLWTAMAMRLSCRPETMVSRPMRLERRRTTNSFSPSRISAEFPSRATCPSKICDEHSYDTTTGIWNRCWRCEPPRIPSLVIWSTPGWSTQDKKNEGERELETTTKITLWARQKTCRPCTEY